MIVLGNPACYNEFKLIIIGAGDTEKTATARCVSIWHVCGFFAQYKI